MLKEQAAIPLSRTLTDSQDMMFIFENDSVWYDLVLGNKVVLTTEAVKIGGSARVSQDA